MIFDLMIFTEFYLATADILILFCFYRIALLFLLKTSLRNDQERTQAVSGEGIKHPYLSVLVNHGGKMCTVFENVYVIGVVKMQSN